MAQGESRLYRVFAAIRRGLARATAVALGTIKAISQPNGPVLPPDVPPPAPQRRRDGYDW
jgi:hypothetical protein